MEEHVSTHVPGGGQIDDVLKEMQREFKSLILQRTAILRRIVTIRQTINGLASLVGEEMVDAELPELLHRNGSARVRGFTRTCRLILMESTRPLSSQEVCQEIQRRNPALLSHHKDPLASVTTVLNRLSRYGEARIVHSEFGQRVWEWVTGSSTVTTESSAATGTGEAHDSTSE